MKLLLIALLLFIFSPCKSQTQIEYIDAITTSGRFTYIGVKYQPDYNLFQPDFGSMATALEVRQRKYDAAFQLIQHELEKLEALKLINIKNQSILQSYRENLGAELQKIEKLDLSIDQNRTEALEFVTAIFKVPSVRNELEILRSVNMLVKEASKLTISQVCKQSFYKNINGFLKELSFYSEQDLARGTTQLISDFGAKQFHMLNNEYVDLESSTLRRYKNLTTFKTFSDGWYDAVLIASTPQIYPHPDKTFNYIPAFNRRAYISGNRITMITNKDGSIEKVNSASAITRQKSEIILTLEKCDLAGSKSDFPYSVYIF